MRKKINLKTIQKCGNPECFFKGRVEILILDDLYWICPECDTRQLDNNPLSRSTGETEFASRALQWYWEYLCTKDGKKSYRGFVERSNGSIKPFQVGEWARNNHWRMRVARQRDIETEIRIEADRRAAEETARKLEARKLEQPFLEIEDAKLLRDKAHEILRLLQVVEFEDGDGHVIKPAHAPEFRAASRMIVEASNLARLALDMVTSRQDITSKGELISTPKITEVVVERPASDKDSVEN